MHWAFPRNVTSMRILAQLGVDHGLSLAACLRDTGIREHDLMDPAILVSGEQELRLIHNLVGQLAHVPGLGTQAGQRYHFTAFGALGFAMVSCPNSLSALEIALKYFHLTFAFTRFHVESHGEETRVTIDDADVPAAIRAFVVERDAAALVTVQRDLFPSTAALRALHFSFPPSGASGTYADFYRLAPLFDAKENLAVLSTADLMAPFSQANALAFKAAEEQCRILLGQYQSKVGLAAKIRVQLLQHGGKGTDMDAVAGSLCMTARTLRRRLLDEGTTFLQLRDEVRCALAREFLAESVLSVEQIAERLGYAEPTSFINAFKRWCGKTPFAYRKATNQPGRRHRPPRQPEN